MKSEEHVKYTADRIFEHPSRLPAQNAMSGSGYERSLKSKTPKVYPSEDLWRAREKSAMANNVWDGNCTFFLT